jgi:hypothetical protein
MERSNVCCKGERRVREGRLHVWTWLILCWALTTAGATAGEDRPEFSTPPLRVTVTMCDNYHLFQHGFDLMAEEVRSSDHIPPLFGGKPGTGSSRCYGHPHAEQGNGLGSRQSDHRIVFDRGKGARSLHLRA